MWRNLAKYFADFSLPISREFPRKWAQEISRKDLYNFPEPRSNMLSPRDSGSSRAQAFFYVNLHELAVSGGRSIGTKGFHSFAWAPYNLPQRIQAYMVWNFLDPLSVARGLLQGRPLQLPMGWGVGEKLTKSWPTFEQLCVHNIALAISYCFSTSKSAARTKSGWLEVDHELDMGCQLLTRTFVC